ncbi:unnamed protein product [Orchesella dallaii]|uniref:ERAP1-like C-terminal domain-containing protein n=1 Tax=Orchesella dallaii TaxID=48710 RepID=A0ABP1RVA4_9HEXA
MNTFLIILVVVAPIFHVDGTEQSEISIPPVKLLKENERWNMDKFFAAPPHFDINMKYNRETHQDLIQSHIRVSGQNREKAKRLVLMGHLMEFNTSSIRVTCQGRVIETKKVYYKFDNFIPLVDILFQEEIEALSELEIYMEYTMQVRDWSILWNASGNEKRILVNHKEDKRMDHPIACSYMFPCFGDRIMSTFNLTIIRENGYSSVANGDTKHSRFQPEGPYSHEYTWLTAVRPEAVTFVIFSNDFQYVDSVYGKGNKFIRVYAPKEEINRDIFQFTANVSAEVFTYFEDHGLSFKKLDLFFVPQSSTTIETQDINVYGYSTNFDSNHSATGEFELTKEKLIKKLVPGLIKQWLDPLRKEYIHIDINARFVEYLALRRVTSFNSTLTDLAVYQDFKGLEKLNGFSAEDELRLSNKAALLVRFSNGLYMGDDDEISMFFGFAIPLPEEGDPFWINKGMPVVRVSIANNTHFAFKQEPFRNRNLDAEAEDEKPELWILLVAHVPNLQKSEPTVLTPDDKVVFASGNTEEYLFVNPTGSGYYRTFYDDPILLNRIQTQLYRNHETFSPLARARLLSDYFLFAENGYSNYSTAIRLSDYLNKETSLVVWTAFLDKFLDIYSKFLNHPEYHVIEYFLMQKVDFRIREMEELSDLSEEQQLLRVKLLSVSCRFRSIRYRILDPPYCLFYARELFHMWSSVPNGASPLDSISPWSLRSELKCSILASSGKESFDFMFAKFRNLTPESGDYNDTLRSLGCAHDTNVIQVLLEKTLQPPSAGGFSQREVAHLLLFMIESPASSSRPQIISFVSKNYEQLAKKVENGDFFIQYLVNSLAYQVYTLEQRDKVKQLLELHQPELFNSSNSLTDGVDVLNIMDKNIDWMNRYKHDIITGVLTQSNK